MCDYSFIIQVVAAVTTAYGQKKSADYNAAVLTESAKTDDALARDALNRGNQEQISQADKTRGILARQTARMAANNVDLQTGTPLDILGDTALFGAVDEQRVRMNAAREAYGHKQAAMDKRNQAKMEKWGGRVGMFTSILGAAGQMVGGMAKKSGTSSFNKQVRSGNTYSNSAGANNVSGFGYNPLAGGPR